MDLIDFASETKKSQLLKDKKDEIFAYISDERILRALFESKIFRLRNIQKETIEKGLFFGKSFLICAPSGSGKTLIGELCAVNTALQCLGKAVYLVPFKALATEKYVHFKKTYEKYGLKVILSIGDYDAEDSELARADVIVTTYEKLDSLVRNFHYKEWIFEITSIIIDEIHIIGEGDRGPRLESLIVRLNDFLNHPQIVGLSATIANPETFNSWLSSLGNISTLIYSDHRPVPLHYNILRTQNKESTIKKLTSKTLEEGGQVVVFLNTRKNTREQAFNLKETVKRFIIEEDRQKLVKIANDLKEVKGFNQDLKKILLNGVAFHHAGLLPKERKLVEDNYRQKLIKVLCCTTTLSAGVNIPARVVILKNFKKYVTSGKRIGNFEGFHENSDGFTYFKAFTSNEVFQMLGRAGRPGLDSVGRGYILVKDLEEKEWVEEYYFKSLDIQSLELIPRYNDLLSSLNNMNTLMEQTLLRVYEEEKVTLERIVSFFEKTYFWYNTKENDRMRQIPIEELLMIREISALNVLKLHSHPNKVEELKKRDNGVKITGLTKSTINGYVKSEFGVFSCQFDINTGVRCSCGFENGISDNFAKQEFSFEFCDHITLFLMHLLKRDQGNFLKHINDIVPKSVKNQYVLNYLFDKGLLLKIAGENICCSRFGRLIVSLYLYPMSGVLIRHRLENIEIKTYKDLITEAYGILKAEKKVRDNKMLLPVVEYADEVPLDQIIEDHGIFAGDLYAVKNNMERVMVFIKEIARHLSETDPSLVEVTEMAETLTIRLKHGIKEELFDLVLRLPNVGRSRARILYDAGFHTVEQVRKQNYYLLHRKTGLGVRTCKKLVAKE
ncbi:MAG: DEAD/DEAH box helicase [Candidatus Lokiarchaeota archaeon]|nr:DEAD/DEAH box helicase [Candidatus Lokiarchaeota archaeon]